MGFDKPDLAFVVHFQRPPSAIAYYQQIGRAGRGVERAEVVLLAGREDDEIADHFIDGAFPSEAAMVAVLDAVDELDGAGVRAIEAKVNATAGTIEQTLKLLQVDGAVARDGAGWIRTVNPWSYDHDRVERVTAARRSEQRRMAEFTETGECLMCFLTQELDDPEGNDCGRCANCAEPFAAVTVAPELVVAAQRFLKHAYRPIEPRKQWPAGLDERSGRIPEEERLREGRALAVYGDAGWGRLVKEGKYGDGDGFADELVDAVAEMVAEDLQPAPPPRWVTAVPSRRSPDLVPDFARRLAGRLGLPYRSALMKTQATPPQKEMENSAQQARNALDSFAADRDEVVSEPVLLVDDMVDSRWSLTVCGIALAAAGSGPVYPIALGQTTTGAAP